MTRPAGEHLNKYGRLKNQKGSQMQFKTLSAFQHIVVLHLAVVNRAGGPLQKAVT